MDASTETLDEALKIYLRINGAVDQTALICQWYWQSRQHYEEKTRNEKAQTEPWPIRERLKKIRSAIGAKYDEHESVER